MPAIRFSRDLAIVLGLTTPVLELIRRGHQLGDLRLFFVWFDDVLLGAVLLFGAWSVSKDRQGGQRILTAAWGFMCGLAYGSFFGQLLALNQPDPSGMSPLFVVGVKGLGLALAVVGLITSLKPLETPTVGVGARLR